LYKGKFIVNLFKKLFLQKKTPVDTPKKQEEALDTHPVKLSYTEVVMHHLQAQNYEVESLEKTKEDDIEFLAIRNNELLLVLCKHYSKKEKFRVSDEKLINYIAVCDKYYKRHSKYDKYQKKALYVTSEDVLNEKAKKLLKDKKFFIKYKII
jgi:hypothetical protein